MEKQQILAIIDDALTNHTSLQGDHAENAAQHIYIELESNGIL